jgi:hypothetical protein
MSMSMKNLEALKTVVAMVKGEYVPPSIAKVRGLAVRNATLSVKASQAETRAAAADRRADLVEQSVANTEHLVKEMKKQQERKRKAARQGGRDTKDGGLWDRYETFRAMEARTGRGEKQLAVATELVEKSKGKIDYEPGTVCRYFRAWKKKRKGKRIG